MLARVDAGHHGGERHLELQMTIGLEIDLSCHTQDVVNNLKSLLVPAVLAARRQDASDELGWQRN